MKQIKICGLSRKEDIKYVNKYKPQYIGIVFANSKRQVTLEQAKYLYDLLDSDIIAVGVFVNEELNRVVEIVNSGCIDIVQLHGQEDADYIQKLKQQCTIKIIKAINVKQKEDMKNIHYDVDYYLLDGATSGSGESFDWSYITTLDKPYFLAGGISLDNLDKALLVPSYGIDISSGVETNSSKDEKKIKEVIRRIRNESR
ncbi:MAG: phosphoribosylanthranilate isomerase [Coprobacillaceae bacterium]